MNHPYLYPDEAPWTEDYAELVAARRAHDPENEPSDTPECDD